MSDAVFVWTAHDVIGLSVVALCVVVGGGWIAFEAVRSYVRRWRR